MSSLLRTSCENDFTNNNILVKDVFVINNYNGNGNTYKVNNKLNMTTSQFMVRIKNNDSNSDYVVYDTIRNINKELASNKTFSEFLNTDGLYAFNNGSYSIGRSPRVNNLNNNYTSITFKKFQKFFDLLEYVGDGTSNRIINHDLNCEIGLISIKAEDIYSNWLVRHKDATGELIGEQPYKQQESFTQIVEITDTYFKVSNNANLLGVKYIVYIYAHNSLSSGFIQCGSYTGGYQEVNDTVIGTGTLKIPDDVTEITLICKGGTGGNNFWNDPGQPYVPGVPEQKYIAPIYAWTFTDDYSMTTAPVTSLELWNSFAHERPLQPVYAPTGLPNENDSGTYVNVEWWIGTMDNPVFKRGHYTSYLVDAGQPFIAAIPEQPFKPATSGGDIYSGGYSKLIVNDITHVFAGGSGGPAMPETLIIQLDETSNRYINYNIANGGSLIYKYNTGGITNVVLDYTLAPTIFTTNLVNRGSIEIPKGVTKVNITCSGGIGSNDTYLVKPKPYIAPTISSPGQEYIAPFYTNPGRPYIAPSGYNPGQPYIAPTPADPGQEYIETTWKLEWQTFRSGTYSKHTYALYSTEYPSIPSYPPTNINEVINQGSCSIYVPPTYANGYVDYYNNYTSCGVKVIEVVDVLGQEYRAPTPATPGQPYIAPSYSNPGQSYIAPSGYNPGQPYIAPTYSDPGQEAVEAVYLNPGQPYIAPTPYDPGQPYIAKVIGQEYRAPRAAVAQEGEAAFPNGLPKYVAGVTGVPGTPEQVTPAGWRYSKWDILAPEFWAQLGITSKFLPYDLENYDFGVKPEFPNKWYKIYAHQPPGSDYYYYTNESGTVLPTDAVLEVAGQVPMATVRNFTCRYKQVSGTGWSVTTSTMDMEWFEEEITPAVPEVVGVAGQGNAAYPDGLPPYRAAVPADPGQPYIAAVAGQPYIAPIPSSPGQPYIAPIIGVGDLVGPSSYISINNSTFNYPGSLGWEDPVITRNILTLKGDSSQSLVYNIPPTGHLSISYEIPNYDKNINDSFKPYYLLIKKLNEPGDWIEIDCRRPDFNLKQNKSDPIDNTNLVIINDNGFSPNHILINEMNQKYVYMVIRK